MEKIKGGEKLASVKEILVDCDDCKDVQSADIVYSDSEKTLICHGCGKNFPIHPNTTVKF